MPDPLPPGFVHHAIAPEGRDFLASSVLLHADFSVVPIPEEEIDFENPERVLPLLIAATTYGPLVFTVSARPAYGDGTVAQWLEFLCKKEGFEHGPIRRTAVGRYPAVMCDARQVGEGITMTMRLVLFEDGGRTMNLTAMAPEPLWSGVEARLQTMLDSFEFAQTHGTSVPLLPGESVPFTAPTAEAQGAVTSGVTETMPGEASPETARLNDEEFAELVLARDISSFDPEHAINANLRDRGVGLVPNIVAIDETECSARLAAGSIESIIRVPMGWHVIDDGRRTLIFDSAGHIQINLDQRRLEDGQTLSDLGRSFIASYLKKQPELAVAELGFDGVHGIAIRGVVIDGETLDQAFFLRDLGRDGLVLVARATGTAEHSRRAMNLAGDILVRLEPIEALTARH